MARKAEGTGKIRADLEAATLALVDIEEVAPFIRKRIEQAVRRAGLDKLLGPALEDLDRMCSATESAKAQVNAALGKLVERQ